MKGREYRVQSSQPGWLPWSRVRKRDVMVTPVSCEGGEGCDVCSGGDGAGEPEKVVCSVSM